MAAIYGYLPNVIAAILIFVVAGAIAGAVAALVTKVMGDTPTGKLVATVVPVLIMGIAVFMILNQLQIAPEIVIITYAVLLGSLGLGMALAFGLGGRETAARLVSDAYDKGQEQQGQVKADMQLAKDRSEQRADQAKDKAREEQAKTEGDGATAATVRRRPPRPPPERPDHGRTKRWPATREKGVSLAKGPVGIVGIALLAYGISALIFGGHQTRLSPVDGTVTGSTWLGLEVNLWSSLLFTGAGALLLFGSPTHWGAKSLSLIVGLVLGAASVIALFDGDDVFGIFAANGWTKLAWGAAGTALIVLSLLPRVGGGKKRRTDDDDADEDRSRRRVEREPRRAEREPARDRAG